MARFHRRGATILTPIVLDASTTISFLVPDEASTYATAAVRSALHDGILVPSLWAYEIENALLIIHRRKRITDTELDDAFAELATWSVRSQPSYGFGVSARIAANTGLTSYDASYLSVALNSGARLATLDRKLREAARNLGARLFEDESDKL